MLAIRVWALAAGVAVARPAVTRKSKRLRIAIVVDSDGVMSRARVGLPLTAGEVLRLGISFLSFAKLLRACGTPVRRTKPARGEKPLAAVARGFFDIECGVCRKERCGERACRKEMCGSVFAEKGRMELAEKGEKG